MPTRMPLTPQAPRSKSQRGKASPKTSRALVGTRSRGHEHFVMAEHAGSIARMVSAPDQIFTVCQVLPEANFTQQVLSFNSASAAYGFSQSPQSSAWGAVFDQYKIDAIQVTFRPMFLAQPLTATSTVFVPLLYLVVDYDDSSVSGYSAATFQQYGNCNVSMYETVSVTFVPHLAVAGAYGSTFASYTNLNPQWIDCASPNVTHYGIKYGCDGGSSGQTALQSWQISTRMKLSFRNVH